jgi:putative ABC transport system permease protein
MKFNDIISLAQKAIKSNRLRFNLTIAIIAIGITALIGIITVIEVLKGTIHDNFAGMGSNTFNITAQSVFAKNKKMGKRRRTTTTSDKNKIKLDEAATFKDRFQFPATISTNIMATNSAVIKRNSKKSNPNIMVMGADENYLLVSGTNLVSGRNFSSREIASGENVCILGNSIATKYFGNSINTENGLINLGDARYRVVGVMESKGASFIDRTDNMVIITINNARQRFNISQKSCVISVRVHDLKWIEAASDEAEGVMRSVRRLRPGDESNFSINKNDEIANSLIDNLKFVTLSASLIGFITLLGAAIGLMNIMLVSVAERTREIGLTKAIGANSQTIKLQFLSEAIFISLKGGFIGIVIGILIGNILSFAFSSPFVIPWMWIGIGLSICIVVGLLAGIYPALKASRLNPINALRYE